MHKISLYPDLEIQTVEVYVYTLKTPGPAILLHLMYRSGNLEHRCFLFGRNIVLVPWKSFIFIILKMPFLHQRSKKIVTLMWKTEALPSTVYFYDSSECVHDRSILQRVYIISCLKQNCGPGPVLLFWPMYRLGHPKNPLLFLLEITVLRSKYYENIAFSSENKRTDIDVVVAGVQWHCARVRSDWVR